MPELIKLVDRWKNWSLSEKGISESKDHDGWQSSFPFWGDLISTTSLEMCNPKINQKTLQAIEFVWGISEETEDLKDFAMENIENTTNVIFYLCGSSDHNVRWQAFDVLALHNSIESEMLLRVGIQDSNSYCKRKALIALSNRPISDAFDILSEILISDDPYLRKTSLEFLKQVTNKESKDTVLDKLESDSIDFVRVAAIEKRKLS